MPNPSEPSDRLEREIDAVAALKDPVRRRLFLHVSRAADDVSRDQAAAAVGISRALAAFHLDKLVEHGLLDTAFRRLTGRSGPGAGRPSKLYRRSGRELSLTLPFREYELAARLLARAMECDRNVDPRRALHEVAYDAGGTIGRRVTADAGPRRPADLGHIIRELSTHGYEPYQRGDDVYLGNCPFQGLTGDHARLVCAMNLSLMQGLVGEAGCAEVEARLDPAPGRCCVVLGRRRHL